MKTLNYFLLTLFCFCLIIACDVNQTDEEFSEENLSAESLSLESTKGRWNKHKKLRFEKDKGVVAFKAEFFTKNPGVGIVEDPRCSPPFLLETQTGDGHARGLGDFSILFNFCIDVTDVLDDGQLTEAEGDSATEAGPYYKGVGTFTFANGDKLFGKLAGAVLPTDKPGFSAEFMDAMVFTGGTGKFEDAQGGGLTNSFVTFGVGTEHEFSGVLVLPKHRGNHDWEGGDDWDDDDDDEDGEDDD